MSKLNSAKSVMVHYLQLAARGGWDWDWDNQSEIEGAIDTIVETAVSQTVAKLNERIEKLESIVKKVNTNMVNPAMLGKRPLHINDLQAKTANLISQTVLQDDPYHDAISEAAVVLVSSGLGECRYAGQYQSGTTLWIDDSTGEAFVFNGEIVKE